MSEDDYINTQEALKRIGELRVYTPSLPTLIEWIKKYDLGHKVGGRWRVNKEKLDKFMKGELEIRRRMWGRWRNKKV
jgi:hypothetical protein